MITLAVALTSHKLLIISPGSTIVSSDPIVAVFHSSSLLSKAKKLSTTSETKWISLGNKEDTDAEDLLVTGLALVASKEVVEIPEFAPTDLVFTMMTEDGTLLPFTHLVS